MISFHLLRYFLFSLSLIPRLGSFYSGLAAIAKCPLNYSQEWNIVKVRLVCNFNAKRVGHGEWDILRISPHRFRDSLSLAFVPNRRTDLSRILIESLKNFNDFTYLCYMYKSRMKCATCRCVITIVQSVFRFQLPSLNVISLVCFKFPRHVFWSREKFVLRLKSRLAKI